MKGRRATGPLYSDMLPVFAVHWLARRPHEANDQLEGAGAGALAKYCVRVRGNGKVHYGWC